MSIMPIIWVTIILAIGHCQVRAILLPRSEIKPLMPAPMVDVHTEIWRQPDQYYVYLAEGYTIAEHFHTIGQNLTHRIKRRWDDPDLDHPNYAFTIYLTDQSDLDLIRRDSRVKSVGQDFKSADLDIWFDWTYEEPDNPLRIAQEARLNWRYTKPVQLARPEPGFVVRKFPHEYYVYLDRDWTIEGYFTKLERDWIDRTKKRSNPDGPWSEASFIIHLEDEADLAVVRASAEPIIIAEHAEYLPLSFFENDNDMTCNAEPRYNPFFVPDKPTTGS
ncbi:uncharacterized protein K489DRAFT_376761 [Dissoconium aciculare CBS 342.82]|uniref:Carbohydrate-binding domain-containing protein n=1 Tax=Dissoconium aciculare CBS 342.82 TaxID=1314786 RepID=A0A6J3MEB2_9PEZI|nr:uncharacterized protein K489DRAFT_376761 [Dissoconium aciculare CBS 342.82]KAF1826351.1 hypothetical protein K489DRAFT_376761 [Dissoconium aciculare CBS 342.82]